MTHPTVVDTVVLLYFLFADRADLLFELLGRPIYVPRVVFDPAEGDVPDAMRSEITKSIAFQTKRSIDQGRTEQERDVALRNKTRLATAHGHVAQGNIEIIDLSEDEQLVFADLMNPQSDREGGRVLALGRGEAACVAIAVTRDMVVATDDSDGVKALKQLKSKRTPERIRRLLMRAGKEGLCDEVTANAIHAEMMQLGFWDKTPPFPAP